MEEVKARVKNHLKLRIYSFELEDLKQQIINKDKEIDKLKAELKLSSIYNTMIRIHLMSDYE